MEILYQTYDFFIKFSGDVFADKYPSFVLRSVFGKNLKDFACILKGKPCEKCPLKFQCVYSFIFESPIKKDNDILAGRDRATHPFTLSCLEDFGIQTDRLRFRLSLFGRAVDYFPYIYYAFLKGEEQGLFRQRVSYKIEKITSDNTLVYDGKNEELNTPEPKKWSLNTHETIYRGEIRLNFLTPVRLKVNGKYTSDIRYKDVFLSAFKKAELMTKMYGKYDKIDINSFKLSPKKEDINLAWKEYRRYSGRQKTEMFLGGNVGSMLIKGDFTEFETSILKSAEIFGLGKNTGFGFGKINVEVIDG